MLQISAKELTKVLEDLGFVFVSQKSRHIKLRKATPTRKTIIIPNHKIIRPGTLNNILQSAGFSLEELKRLLKQ